jgi:Protein of unknown function (DUF3800)
MPLFAFLDESGTYAFNRQHGDYLVYTAVITATPTLFAHEFAHLRYDLHQQGTCLERFHACEDLQVVRDQVFRIICSSTDYAVHSIIVRKKKINPVLYKHGVYSIAYRTMLRYLVGGRTLDKVCMIVDTVPDQSQQTTLKATLQARAGEALNPRGIPFTIHHHNSASHPLLQVADYCAWAIYRKWQSDDHRSYIHVQRRIRNEFDLFARGDAEYC